MGFTVSGDHHPGVTPQEKIREPGQKPYEKRASLSLTNP